MKKIVVVLLVCFAIFCVLGLININQLNIKGIDSNYNIVSGETYKIENTLLSLKPIKYEGDTFNILCYDNDKLDSSKEGSLSSFVVGKNCISITGSVLDVNNIVNRKIMSSVVKDLQEQLSKENTQIVTVNEKVDMPYIVSKDEKNIFIDLVSTTSASNNKVIYYRIIIQNARNLESEISDEEYFILSDYLPDLLKILEIPEEDLQ